MKKEDIETVVEHLQGTFVLLPRWQLKHWVASVAFVLAALGLGGFFGAWNIGKASAEAWMLTKSGLAAKEEYERIHEEAEKASSAATAASRRWGQLEEEVQSTLRDFPNAIGENLKIVSAEFTVPGIKVRGVDVLSGPQRRQLLAGVEPATWQPLGSWTAVEGSGFIKNVRDDANDQWWAAGAFGVKSRTVEDDGKFYAELVIINGHDNGDHGGFKFRIRHTAIFSRISAVQGQSG